jgi:DNA repair photolyase
VSRPTSNRPVSNHLVSNHLVSNRVVSNRVVSNPANPFESTSIEWVGPPPLARTQVFEERAKSILVRNDNPDVPFTWGLNPYRGCEHACAYCFARVHHQFLSLGAGTDFDHKIVVKTNAAELLHRKLSSRSWRGEPIHFSGVTDAYQPLEATWRLTRRCLGVCVARNNPVGIVTKSSLVRRDIDLLARLARGPGVCVYLSIPFADAPTARLLEPGAPSPERRFATLRALARRGIPVGVGLAPLIPGLNESDVPTILRRASEAGARSAFLGLIHLADEALVVFRERVEEALPDRATHVFSAMRDVRRGSPCEPRFGERRSQSRAGRGARWEATQRLFEIHCRRLGLAFGEELEGMRLRPSRPRITQGLLFPDGEGS